MRIDNRDFDELRAVEILPDYIAHAEGSVLVSYGLTKVICTVSVENSIPKWLQGTGEGWLTAEYSMLPRSTHTRVKRDRATNSGRSQEISRLIGRSLRSIIDLKALGEKQIIVDCDVIQADGGTRTAAITGSFVALVLATKQMIDRGEWKVNPLTDYLAAVSIGIQEDRVLLDLCYEEDAAVETDMNFVMTGKGGIVEVQGTAEGEAFSKKQLDEMYDLAQQACRELNQIQAQQIGDFFSLKEM